MSQHKVTNTITSETTCLPKTIEFHGFVYEDLFKKIERITAEFDGFRKEYLSQILEQNQQYLLCETTTCFL